MQQNAQHLPDSPQFEWLYSGWTWVMLLPGCHNLVVEMNFDEEHYGLVCNAHITPQIWNEVSKLIQTSS